MRCVLVLITALAGAAHAQVAFESSNLPIVVIDTDGAYIPREKIPARMSVIDNGPGERNSLSDPPEAYDGWIGIEQRGSSSSVYPKRQYGIETRDDEGENLNVPLLGLPSENDWVLNGPYADKTLVRNAIGFHVYRAMGRYASRVRFVEVVLDGDYQGVYTLLEKVKRDGDRVDIARLNADEVSGDDLTGGYIVQIDRPNAPGWYSAYHPEDSTASVFYQLRTPDPDRASPEQVAYIQRWIEGFEDAMAADAYSDPVVGYPAYLDVDSFVDYILATEAVFDSDGYRLSTYLHKDKDANNPLLQAGPAWDHNLALASDVLSIEGYQYDRDFSWSDHEIAFWWPKLAAEPAFRAKMVERWVRLRRGPLHTDSLLAYLDGTIGTLSEAQARNFQRWPIHGVAIYPSAFVGESYEEDVQHMRDWFVARLAWMDEDLKPLVDSTAVPPAPCAPGQQAPYPNPAQDRVRLRVCTSAPGRATVEAVDVRGRRVAGRKVILPEGHSEVELALEGVAPGIYLLRVVGDAFRAVQRVTVVP